MRIGFSDRATCEVFNHRSALVRRFGEDVAAIACRRLAVLLAAPTLEHVPSAPPMELDDEGGGRFSVAAGTGHRLRFTSDPAVATAPHLVTDVIIIGLEALSVPKGTNR